MRTNMPMYFEQDIYCLAIGHHDSALVRDWVGSFGSSHYTAPFSASSQSLSQSN